MFLFCRCVISSSIADVSVIRCAIWGRRITFLKCTLWRQILIPTERHASLFYLLTDLQGFGKVRPDLPHIQPYTHLQPNKLSLSFQFHSAIYNVQGYCKFLTFLHNSTCSLQDFHMLCCKHLTQIDSLVSVLQWMPERRWTTPSVLACFLQSLLTVFFESSCTKLIPIDLEKSNAGAETRS